MAIQLNPAVTTQPRPMHPKSAIRFAAKGPKQDEAPKKQEPATGMGGLFNSLRNDPGIRMAWKIYNYMMGGVILVVSAGLLYKHMNEPKAPTPEQQNPPAQSEPLTPRK